jgi:putative spermidine/putrescine transport system substrate-binding protein
MTIGRRLGSGIGAVLCIAMLFGGAEAQAGKFDGVTIKFATFGGKWRDIVEKHVAKPFEAEGGKIEFVLGQPANNMAKLISARGQEAPFDILETMDNLMPQLIDGGFIEKLDLKKIPNVSTLNPSFYDATRVMVWITEEGIVYNTAKLKEAGIPIPTKYADLANPKLKGKVSVPDISAGGAIPAIVGFAYEAGGNESNIEPGLDLIAKVAPASFWSSSSNLQTQLQNGDVWVAAAQAGNVQRLKGQVPLSIAFMPVNGKSGVLKQGYLVKVKGTKHPEAVEWLINAFLALPMQVAVSTEGGQIPVSAPALAEIQKDTSLSFMRLQPQEIAGMYQVDYSKVDQTAYVQKWNRKLGRR